MNNFCEETKKLNQKLLFVHRIQMSPNLHDKRVNFDYSYFLSYRR